MYIKRRNKKTFCYWRHQEAKKTFDASYIRGDKLTIIQAKGVNDEEGRIRSFNLEGVNRES